MWKAIRTFLIAAPIALLISAQLSPAFWHGLANAISNSGIGGSVLSIPGTDGAINVKNYGAVGNGQMYSDGYMASASSTLTTKQPLTSASESSTTVTLTFTNNIPGVFTAPPYTGKWTVGGSITVAGVTGSDAAGYNGTFTIASIPTATTLTYTALSSGLSSGSGGTAYTNAPFASGDASKLICVNGAASGNLQTCGTISSFSDAEDVTLSFSNASGAAIFDEEFVYGTSDQTAIAGVFSNTVLPNGGIVFFPPGIYVMTAEIDMPLTGSWVIEGSGSGQAPTEYGSGNIGAMSPTTALVYLTTSMTSGSSAFYFGKGLSTNANTGSINFQQQTVAMRDIGLIGGAGLSGDGGGYSNAIEGITLNGTNDWHGTNITVQNFSGDCVYVNGAWTGFLIENSFMASCQNWGVNINSIQAGNLIGNYIQGNGGGVQMGSGGVARGVNVLGNTIQGNARLQNISLGPGLIAGNYFENGAPFTSYGSTAAAAVFMGNYSAVGAYQLIFSAAGTALPTCSSVSYTAHIIASVSDAHSCTAGTTYSSGSSTACNVQCNGTNWIETGVAPY